MPASKSASLSKSGLDSGPDSDLDAAPGLLPDRVQGDNRRTSGGRATGVNARACSADVRRQEKRVDAIVFAGNTIGMKAAVSIPDDVFEQGERLARRLHTSRSQLYARALADFVVLHEDDKITASMNKALEEVGPEADEFTRRAARQTLRRVEW